MTGKLAFRLQEGGIGLGEWNELGIGVRTSMFWYHKLYREVIGNKAGEVSGN